MTKVFRRALFLLLTDAIIVTAVAQDANNSCQLIREI